jgi:Sulfotransferase domain.
MKTLPSFLCIGTQKAGTSWLYEQLRQHPNIWMPPIKELHYFDHLYCESSRNWSKWHIKHSAKRIIKHEINSNNATNFDYIRYIASLASEPMLTEAWYKKAFDRPAAKNKVVGDITPEYCQIGDEGISYLKGLLTDVKILWIIRDPFERMLSQLRMNAERQGVNEASPTEKWMELAYSPDILSRGNYLDYIPRWEAQFSEDNLRYIPFKHIADQASHVLQNIEDFIGVQNWDGYASPEKKIHATQAFDLTEEVKVYLQQQCQPQYDFLSAHFDADFVNAI